MKQFLKKFVARQNLSLALTGILALAIIVSNSSAAKAQRVPDTTLRVGQKAPPFQVYQWLKGSPVSLNKDQIYVVEFTNTSCAPCRASIPHIAKLARNYQGKVTFISVYVFENQLGDNDDSFKPTSDYTSHVKKFILSQGSKFDDIHIGIDDPRQTMTNSWMFSAGNRGVPVVYVIDGKGAILWMGGPMKLDAVIERVVEGNFDPVAGLRSITEEKEAYKRMDQFLQAGDRTRAIAIIDSLIAANPEDSLWYCTKFQALLDIDEPTAYAYGRELLEHQCRNSQPALLSLAFEIIYKEEGVKLIPRDYDLAIDFFDRAFALSPMETGKAVCISGKARCYYLKGEYKKAVQTEKEAIAYLKKYGDQGDCDVHEMESSFSRELEEFSKKTASR